MPGDLFATPGGYVRIVGLKGGKVMSSRSLDWNTHEVLEEFDKARSRAVLVSRRVLPSTRVCKLLRGGCIEVSVFVRSFAGLMFLPGDEILIDGEHYIVFGNKGGYLWIQKLGTEGVSFFNPTTALNSPRKAELFRRPTEHWDVFLE
jgi:hypothetical protein